MNSTNIASSPVLKPSHIGGILKLSHCTNPAVPNRNLHFILTADLPSYLSTRRPVLSVCHVFDPG